MVNINPGAGPGANSNEIESDYSIEDEFHNAG